MGDINSTDREAEPFAPIEPKREWLVRCMQPEDTERISVCSVGAEAGTVVIWGTEDQPVFVLDGSQIGEFRAAFQEATKVADRDIQERRLARLQASDAS